MISEHSEMVTRVEENVDDATENVNSTLLQLTNTLNSLRTNRMLAAKVFGVVVFFIIMFVMLIA